MNVLHVIPAVAVRYGGPSRAVVQMCRALREAGSRPLLATTDADGDGRLDVQRGHRVVYDGVDAVFFKRQWSESFKYSAPLALWLRAQAGRFDVVHIHALFSHSSLAAAKACRQHRVPYVVRPLGSLNPWGLRRKRLQKRILWRLAVRRMLDEAAAVHCTTAEELRLARQSLPLPQGCVISLGVETPAGEPDERFRRAHESVGNRPYVLAMGRLHPVKGLERLISEFVHLTTGNGLRHWRLVVAGRGQPHYLTTLRHHVEALGGTGRVVFAGWLEGEMKRSALACSSLLAQPSHQENFGLAAAEAMASGVPVFVSRHVNLADDVITAGAGWVTSLEADEFRQKLGEAIADQNERSRRGMAGLRLATRKFEWSAVARQLQGLYRSILRGDTGVASDVGTPTSTTVSA